jgi:hypothetical protein
VTVKRDYPALEPPANLSALLAAAHDDLTRYVRASTDSSAALLAIMASDEPEARQADSPLSGASRVPAAARAMRAGARSLARAIRQRTGRLLGTTLRVLGAVARCALGLAAVAALGAGLFFGVKAGGLIAVLTIGVAVGTGFLMAIVMLVIIGVHQEERRRSIVDRRRPPTLTALLARRVLGSYFYLTPDESRNVDQEPDWTTWPLGAEPHGDGHTAPRA